MTSGRLIGARRSGMFVQALSGSDTGPSYRMGDKNPVSAQHISARLTHLQKQGYTGSEEVHTTAGLTKPEYIQSGIRHQQSVTWAAFRIQILSEIFIAYCQKSLGSV